MLKIVLVTVIVIMAIIDVVMIVINEFLKSKIKVDVKIIEGGELPKYQRKHDACLDCYSRINVVIPKGKRVLVPLGFALELPTGYEAIVRPRSGLSRDEIDVAIGTIDSNYRGEVMACVINNTSDRYEISAGDRICQLAIREAPQIKFNVVEELSETERGSNGFGSSGK